MGKFKEFEIGHEIENEDACLEQMSFVGLVDIIKNLTGPWIYQDQIPDEGRSYESRGSSDIL